jgi:hypothetical protein
MSSDDHAAALQSEIAMLRREAERNARNFAVFQEDHIRALEERNSLSEEIRRILQLVKDYDQTMLHLRAGGKFDERTYRFLKRRANLAIGCPECGGGPGDCPRCGGDARATREVSR